MFVKVRVRGLVSVGYGHRIGLGYCKSLVFSVLYI